MNPPEDLVCAALDQILETMFFSRAVWTGVGNISGPAMGAKLSFSGTVCGEFRLLVARPLAAALASDFLAIGAADISAAQATAIVHEFSNVACGTMLAAWMPGADLSFSIVSPLSESEKSEPWPYQFSVTGEGPELAIAFVVSSAGVSSGHQAREP
jgi:hypothetical protein